jgi:hypothetical protein
MPGSSDFIYTMVIVSYPFFNGPKQNTLKKREFLQRKVLTEQTLEPSTF